MRDLDRARRDFLRVHRDRIVVRTETTVLTIVSSTYPDVVDRAREVLVARLQTWADRTGHEVYQVSWDTPPPTEEETAAHLVTMRLQAQALERTDGEWPSIHQARREDEADRAAALATSGVVNDRLDALRAAAGYWADPALRGL